MATLNDCSDIYTVVPIEKVTGDFQEGSKIQNRIVIMSVVMVAGLGLACTACLGNCIFEKARRNDKIVI